MGKPDPTYASAATTNESTSLGGSPKRSARRPQGKFCCDVTHEVEFALRGGPRDDLLGPPLDLPLEPGDGTGRECGADHPSKVVVSGWVEHQHVGVHAKRRGAQRDLPEF